MERIPDHPEIARCLCTGYPHPHPYHECQKCGAPAECYGDTSGFLCFDCAKEEFEELTDEEAVELLGFEVITDA